MKSVRLLNYETIHQVRPQVKGERIYAKSTQMR